LAVWLNHRPLASLAKQQTGEQDAFFGGTIAPGSVRLPGTQLGIDPLPIPRLVIGGFSQVD